MKNGPRQGDVILVCATIPAGAKARPGPAVLAYGEATGHLHAVEAPEGVTVELLEHDGLVYLRVTGGEAFLRHGTQDDGRVRELTAPDHGALTVHPGEYIVPGQVTWTSEHGAARVQD